MGEGLSTLTALVGLLPTVNPPVLGQVGLAVEGLAALHALVGPLPGVDHVVLQQVRALDEGLPTLSAFIGLHSRVNLFMSSKKVFLVKAFPTFIALEETFLFLSHGIFA